MSIVLNAEVLAERQSLRARVLSDPTSQGIVTSIPLNNREHFVLSRYEDDVWYLPDSWFSVNVNASNRKLNFKRIRAPALRAEAKRIMFLQIWGNGDQFSIPRGKTLSSHFQNLVSWVEWLRTQAIYTHADVTPLVAQRYVKHVRSLENRQSEQKQLAARSQLFRFSAVEICWKQLRNTPCEFDHPWADSSAIALSGHYSHGKPSTLIIPEDVLAILFQYAESQLARADELLDHRDFLSGIVLKSTNRTGQGQERNGILSARGWPYGVQNLNEALTILRDCCFLLILTTTGIRAHELASIKRDQWFSELRDGDRFYFLRSRSEKTYAGETQWICPEIAITSVRTLERLSEPLQADLERTIDQAIVDCNHVEISRLQGISGCVSLTKANNKVKVLSGGSLIKRLQCLTEHLKCNWRITPHQFRRTFANHVVHHKLGDLRYLRDHFKHWSLDMTALYAMNEVQDLELYDEIYRAFDEKRQSIIGHWLERDTPLSGGMAPYVREMRGKHERVRTYKNRREMIDAISELVYLRSTGIAWCTNDTGLDCAGGQCEDCEHGCIDESHKSFWKGLYAQQIELRQIDDCGKAASETVERTIRRCERVLMDLGVNIEELKEQVADAKVF